SRSVITLCPLRFPYPVGPEFSLFLAPMSGVSESPFRLLCRRFGADVVVSEFISAVGVARGIAHLFEDMRFEEAERPIGIQLYGADAAIMARAAEMVSEVCHPDFIDINFGCPVKKVVRNNGGAGCVKDLGVVPQVIVAMRDHTGCAGAMIARGSFGNPWIFAQGRELLDGAGEPKRADPAPEERLDAALAHARLALRLQGDTRKTALEFRKHFGWYTKGLRDASELRQRLFAIESMSEAEQIFDAYLRASALEVAA